MNIPEKDNKLTRNNKQLVAIIVAIVVAAAIIFVACAYLFTQFFTGHVRSIGQAQTTQLTASKYISTVNIDGTFQASSSSAVSPEVDGTISEVRVSSGAAVKEGDILFIIENSQITQEANQAKSAYDSAGAALQNANVALNNANANLKTAQNNKTNAVNNANNANNANSNNSSSSSTSSSTQDFSSYDNAISDAQAEVNRAQSQVDTATKTSNAAKTSYDNALAKAEKLTVKAPSSGTVVESRVQKGMTTQTVNAQGAAMQIADLSTILAKAYIPAAQVGTISVGLSATITSDSLPGKKINATVSKIADVPTNASATASASFTSSNSSDASTSTSSSAGSNSSNSSAASSSGSTTSSTSDTSSNSNTTDSTDSTNSQELVYEVDLTLDKTDDAKVGIQISAAIELKEFSAVYYVPKTALSQKATYSYVEVVYNDNTTKQHQVQVIDTTDDGQVIIQGNTISDGQRILTDISNK